MMNLVKIVTHGESPDLAAESFGKEGVVAVGWSEFGDLRGRTYDDIKQISKKQWKRTERESASDASQLIAFRDGVNRGDIVFAYKLNNTVALVGEIVSGYKFNTRNDVGDPKGEIGYANQRKVKWWGTPRNFDRHFLPRNLSEWVARPGTIAIRQYDMAKLKRILQKIPSQETVTKALEIHDEDEIKDYMERHLEELEKGLTVIKREQQTSEGPMDFLAKDKRGVYAAIEVKIEADDATVSQLRRYMRSFKEDTKASKVDGIIVAEGFTKRCVDDVRELSDHGMDIALYKCRKKFGFTKL
jgi:predicted Mrr-cat superfamily restriction endonuclease